MDRIAYMIGETFLYWNSIILTLAAAAAICMFAAFYLRFGGRKLALDVTVPLAIVLSLVFARFFHWYSRWDSYPNLRMAMTDYSVGGYALMGVFLGCFLTAVVIRLTKLDNDLPRMLDAMSLGGALGISVGRLACFYSAADRGQILQKLTSLPFAYPITNSVNGQLEYRLATFVIQAMVTGLIFVALAVYAARDTHRKGDITLLFLLLYGASQAVLDSTRYDSLYFRSNGFISIVQILGAVSVVAVAAVFSVRMVRVWGWQKWFPALWVPMAALMGCAGYMEYHVQRHGDQAVFAYSVMSACLLVFVLTALWIYARSIVLTDEEEIEE